MIVERFIWGTICLVFSGLYLIFLIPNLEVLSGYFQMFFAGVSTLLIVFSGILFAQSFRGDKYES